MVPNRYATIKSGLCPSFEIDQVLMSSADSQTGVDAYCTSWVHRPTQATFKIREHSIIIIVYSVRATFPEQASDDHLLWYDYEGTGHAYNEAPGVGLTSS